VCRFLRQAKLSRKAEFIPPLLTKVGGLNKKL